MSDNVAETAVIVHKNRNGDKTWKVVTITTRSCFLYVLRLYMHKALDTQSFQFIKKKRIPFILYSLSFFITAIALIGMFIFRHDSDAFYLFMGLYLLGGLIKLIGKMIYAKLVKDEYLYKSIATPLKKFFLMILSGIGLVIVATIVGMVIYTLFP